MKNKKVFKTTGALKEKRKENIIEHIRSTDRVSWILEEEILFFSPFSFLFLPPLPYLQFLREPEESWP